jgi:transcription antitermination factor NusG
MQKNWYVVYTKPQLEKKVAAMLNKKKIENFCPLGCFETMNFRRSKLVFKPLFKSYLFVFVSPDEIQMIKQADGVLNILYWLGEPAIVRKEEIEAIREFANDHRNIKLERTAVDKNGNARNFNASSYEIDGKIVTITNKLLKLSLPSLGYNMIANVEDDNVFGRKEGVLKNNQVANS